MRDWRAHMLAIGVALAAAFALGWTPAPAAAGDTLRAGAGRADVTPPTGYFLMGWVRSDAAAEGQHTRLFARTLVLERGGRKLALVSVDLAFVPAGLVADVVERLADRGFGEESVIVSASHTHSGPAGFANFPAFNTVAPTDETPTEFELGSPADPQLYTFLAERIAKAIRRADRDLAPAVAGWGKTKLVGLTENRSVEAHLNNHGVQREYDQGSPGLDPLGIEHTLDPQVSVLRVDKLVNGQRVPIGIFSSFANHGTVVKPTFSYYNADHHGAAARLAERRIRRAGDVPRGQVVVNAYGNADEGDMTAGLEHSGPAGAHEVGRKEAKAFLEAWRRARANLTPTPALDSRWTISCFCGNDTAEGPVDTKAVVGFPFLTGSEENRGPLYDETGVPFEGHRLPAGAGPQGQKIQAVQDTGTFPKAVPLTAARVGDRAIVTLPGEMTSGMGRALRAATEEAMEGTGVKRVVLAGLANEFIQYLASPDEYDRQHYEGGSTLFGRTTSVFIQERLVELLELMAAGDPAPPPDEDNRRNGVSDNAAPFSQGAEEAEIVRKPRPTRRLDRAAFRWRGGPEGTDRPLDEAFVVIQRERGRNWKSIDSDLGMRILWTVDEEGNYRALWEAPANARAQHRYRFKVRGNGYRIRSEPFILRVARDLRAVVASQTPGRTVVELRYPEATENEDLTWRPNRAKVDSARLRGHRSARVRELGGRRLVITGDPGRRVRIPVGGLRDPHGNRNRKPLSFTL